MMDPNNPLCIPRADEIPAISKKIPYFLVGDEAFKLAPDMMKPFAGGGLTRIEKIFNLGNTP